jgi:hypothetical protein
MSLYASWVHGHSVQLERIEGANANSKSSVKSAFGEYDGDIIDLGGYGAAACLRLGWAARIVVFDRGTENYDKSGKFWCHYAIPTPVIEADHRAEADKVLVNYISTDISQISVAAIHVWDGNRRIFADDSPLVSPDDFNGGIPDHTTNAGTAPNPGRLYRGDIQRRVVFYGVGVSLLIRAQSAKNNFLEIRSVGVDFQISS